MMILWKFMIIFFTLQSIKSQNNQETINYQKIPANCFNLEYVGCDNGRASIYRNQLFKAILNVSWCMPVRIRYDYVFRNWETGKEVAFYDYPGSHLLVNKFVFDVAYYRFMGKITAKSQSKSINTCTLEVKCIPVYAAIKGGFERYIGFNTEIILDATDSLDYNHRNYRDRSSLIFSWIYSCKKCRGFITAKEKGDIFKLKSGQQEETFHVKLEVQSKFCSAKTKQVTHQMIYVKNKVPQLSLHCTKNCFLPINDGDMVLLAKCENNCPKSKKFIWNLYKAPDDVESLIRGKNDLKLVSSKEGGTTRQIAELEAKLNITYLVTAAFVEQKNIAVSYRFKMVIGYYKQQFDVTYSMNDPEELKSAIMFNCTSLGFDIAHMITTQEFDDITQLVNYDYHYESLPYHLLFHKSVWIQVVHFTEYVLAAGWGAHRFNLQEFKKVSVEEIKKQYHDGTQSTANKFLTRSTDNALIDVLIFARSIFLMDESEVKKAIPLIESMAHDLKGFRHLNIKTISDIALALSDIASAKTIFAPSLAANISNLCKMYGKYYLEFAADQIYGTNADNRVLYTIIKRLMVCSLSVAAKPNPVVKLKESNVENTKVDNSTNSDAEQLGLMEIYKNITAAFATTCEVLGVALSQRIKEHSIKRTVPIDDYEITGMSVPPRPILLNALGVQMQCDQKTFDGSASHYVSLGVTTKNIFWWGESTVFMTDIAIIKMWKEREPMEELPYPVKVRFLIKNKSNGTYFMEYPSDNFNIPGIPETEEESLLIYILPVPANTSIYIEFMELENTTLKVLFTEFELPILEDFTEENITAVDAKKNVVNDGKLFDYYGYRLIGVLNPENIPFKMRAFSSHCAKRVEASWIEHCQAIYLERKNMIECTCDSTSVMVGAMKDSPIKEWQKYIPLEGNLEDDPTYCHIICVFMGFLFLVFSLLLCVGSIEDNQLYKSVYFLGDTESHSRFGYLIIINTGHRFAAGTTSNITIKLHGTKLNSQPHVLNYPDPHLLLLQRGNEDWFFLATNFHLGSLVAMELWFDGIGCLPSWYCDTVRIMDVQEELWYEFRVSRSFDVYRTPKIYYKLEPCKLREYQSFARKLLTLRNSYAWNFRVFNLTWRQTNENLSNAKKLSLMLSIISSMFVWNILLNGLPSLSPMDFMDQGHYTLKGTMGYGISTSLIAAVYHIPITFIFTSSQVQFPYEKASQKAKLPMMLTLICWLIIMVIVTFNISFVIYFGVWYPTVTAFSLIASITIGTVFYILVIETIYGWVKEWRETKLMQNVLNVSNILSKIISDVEYQRSALFNRFGHHMLRPYLEHLYSPLNAAELKMRWLIAQKKFKIKESMETCVMSLVLVLLAFMILVLCRSHHMFYSNEHLKNMMERSRGPMSFKQVHNMSGLISYINDTLVDVTNGETWYGNFSVKDPGMSSDYVNKVLGVIRIRQHRSVLKECEVPEIMRFLNRTCHNHEFDYNPKEAYGVGWKSPAPTISVGDMEDVWWYTNSREATADTVTGHYGTYYGGGYIAFLAREREDSYINMDYLNKNSWFDEMSRCIIIEILLYNANCNIFNAVHIVAEQHMTGYLAVQLKVLTSKPLQMDNDNLVPVSILLYLFIVLVIFFTVRTIGRIYRTGVWFFKDLWHIIDFIIIILCIAYIGQFYHRAEAEEALLKSLEGIDPREFVDHYEAFKSTDTFTLIASFLIAFASIKMWTVFRFMGTFKAVERTFITCFVPLCAIIFWHALVIVTLIYYAYNLFRDSIYRSAEGLISKNSFFFLLHRRPLGDRFLNLFDATKWAHLFYALYALALFIFWCIYASLFIFYYHKARTYFSDIREVYTATDYVACLAKFHYNLLKIRLKSFKLSNERHSQINETSLHPKSDAQRFANTCTLSSAKLRAMSFITLCILRNRKAKHPESLSDEDIRLMTYTLFYLQMIKNEQTEDEDEEKELFYKYTLENKLKLIPEWNMTKIRAATMILLGESKEKTMASLHISMQNYLKQENEKKLKEIQEKLSLMLTVIDHIKIKATV